MAGTTAESTQQSLSTRAIWTIFVGLMLAVLLAALDQTIVATALPTIVRDLGGATHLSWIVTAYLLASTVTTPLWASSAISTAARSSSSRSSRLPGTGWACSRPGWCAG